MKIIPCVAALGVVGSTTFLGSAIAAEPPIHFHDTRYYVLGERTTLRITLTSKDMTGKSSASLCVEGADRPANPCRTIQDWKVGDVWDVTAGDPQHLTVWTTDSGSKAGGEASRDDTGNAKVSAMGFSAGAFRAKFSVSR